MLDWYTLQLKRGADGLFGFSVSSRANCEIDKITKGSSAKESGLKVGDQIFAINDKLVFSTNEIEDMMKNTGHSVSIRVRKAGTTLFIYLKSEFSERKRNLMFSETRVFYLCS